jgi:hypothetical protein
MYLVVRTYEHTDPSYGEEGFRRVRDDLLPALTEIDGFVSYYSAYDEVRGVVTSVSVYVSRDAAEEANRIAVDWGSKNLAVMGTVNATSWVGDVLVAAEGLLEG